MLWFEGEKSRRVTSKGAQSGEIGFGMLDVEFFPAWAGRRRALLVFRDSSPSNFYLTNL